MGTVLRFFDPPKGSFFLFGPRGTGKSLYARTHFPDALRLDLLEPGVFEKYSSRPARLLELAAANPQLTDIVVDEVQKIPELLDAIHSLIEKNRKLRFILTGSSARKLKRAGTNLLAGRAILRTLHPYMAAELGKSFKLESALKHGMLPLALAAPDPADVLRTYAAVYLREEVQMEGLVRKVGAFARFLEVISFSHGSTINTVNIGRECHVDSKTAESYIQILEDLLLAFRLPMFTKKAKRELATHPKFYLFDSGVYRSLRPSGPLDQPEEIEGVALEGLVAQHLRAWLAYSRAEDHLYSWRSRAGLEVDFVVYGDSGIVALEVKNTAHPNAADLRSLSEFKRDYPMAKCALVYRGKERLLRNDILCIPADDFLLNLRPDSSLL